MRPRILDLFCGAGLVADGLMAAGFDVVGVDLAPQPRYPGPFLQHDALALDDRFISMFDAIWASPPCLRDTALNSSARREQRAHGGEEYRHPDLIAPTRALLHRIGKPFVIENVATASLIDPVILCGSHFGLGVTVDDQRFHLQRHRKIETNFALLQPACRHHGPVIGVYGGHARVRAASAGGRGTADFVGHSHNEIMSAAMGLDRYLTCDEISQGVPPAYARYVGEALMLQVVRRRAAA
jgi:DNA (cytosine-5)-methyltransferase 1